MTILTNFNSKIPFVIAEISANHNGSLEKAKKLIFNAKKYGADAVKLQTYTPETMTINSNKSDFKINEGLWKGKTLWSLYKDAQTPFEWQKELFDYSKKINITCFSTPFDTTAVDLLESLKCPFYKVASFEMNDIPLIKRIAKTKKPMIISTGMASLKEIDITFEAAKKNGCRDIVLLYCVSNYPSQLEDFNFNNIKILKERYKCKVGFSDHSTDTRVVSAAVAAGAEIFEKHIALANQKTGPDIVFSAKGKELAHYINAIKTSFVLLGKKSFYRNKSEQKNLKFRRSIYVIKKIIKGEKFSKKNIRIIRPGYGIEPKYYGSLIGKICPINLNAETPLKRKIIKLLKIDQF